MAGDPILARLRDGWVARSAAETASAGEALAGILPADVVLALHGELGAGKTTFVRGLAKGWGIAGPVTSPTFNYFMIYRGARQLVHLDAYRLGKPADADSLMVEEFLEPPWCLAVEWPENLGGRLPPGAWHLHFASPDEHTRVISLRGRG